MTTLSEEFEGPLTSVGPQEEDELAQLYQAAKDENELLEFKNYELLFKIQELEQNQEKILDKLKSSKLLPDTQNHENSHSLMSTPTTNLRRHSTSDSSSHSSTQLKAANNGQDGAEESCDARMALAHPVWPSEREKRLSGGCLQLDPAGTEAATGSQTARFHQQPVTSTDSSSSSNNLNADDDHHDDSDSQLSSIASSSTGGHHSALDPEHDNDDLTKKHGESLHYYSLFARKTNKQLAQQSCPPELLGDQSNKAPTAALTTNHSRSFCASNGELVRGVVDVPEQPKEKAEAEEKVNREWSSTDASEMSLLNAHSAPIQETSDSSSTLVDQTHSLPVQSLKLKLTCNTQNSSSSAMSPQVASSGKRETARLGARKLTRSQPDLSSGQAITSRSNRSTSGGAKIAIPVTARKQQQQQVMALKAAVTRSKSNLTDSSALTTNQVSSRKSSRATASPAALNDQVVGASSDRSPISCRSDSSTRISGRLLRARSSSSVGFVTQIPTLIGHSHASYMHSSQTARPTTMKINRQALSVKVNRAQVVVAAASPKNQQRATRISGSKSMSNLVLADETAHKADNDDQEQQQQQQEPLVTPEKYDEKKREEVDCRESELSGTSVKMTDQHTSSSCSMSQQSLIDGQHETSIEKLVDVNASKPDKFQANSNNCGQQTIDTNNNNISNLVQCAQCKVYQSSVELLIKDKKQLSEQISELEEMENDSRLMSQKLAQQMLTLEQQFEACKSELERTCDRETKLQLQNKKLNFELKQRSETIQQLQCQVSRLEMKFSLKEQQQQSPLDDNNNNNSTVATEIERCKSQELNSTRNLKDLNAEFENDYSSSQLKAQKESTVEDKRIPEVATSTVDGKDCSPTLSVGTTSDDDSAIDLRVAKRQQQVDLRQSDQAKGQTSADDSAYSKSSASSDANSDDGNRSDSEQLTPSLKVVARQQAEKVQDPLEARRSSSSSSGDESDHQTTGCSSSLACSSPSSLESTQTGGSLSSRQQVMRKKISIARILRGIQIQQSSSASRTNSELSSNSTSSSRALLVGQARLAQVVGGDETMTSNDLSIDSSRSCFQDKNQIAGVKGTDKSHIDLALEGVHDLEKGSCADDDLLRLLAQDSNPDRSESFLTESEPNQTRQLDPEMFKLIGQLRKEILGLRTRLIQAHTLNDNLVSELHSSKDRFSQLESHLTGIQLQQQQQQQQPRAINPATKTSSFLGRHQTPQPDWQQQQLHPSQTRNADGQAELAARKSIIYVNGSHPGNRTQIYQQQPLLTSGPLHQQQQLTHKCKSCSSQTQYKCHPIETACVSLNEFVEFLRFLLDKIHFHHGRTFELVNECQNLAINSLLASQKHQLNTLAHNSVILAGNQASRALAQQQLYHPVELYPVRPPPRMRRNRMIVMPSSASLEEESFSSATQEKPLSKLAEQAPTSTATATTSTLTPTTTVGRSSTSALQVAKQTLFSIVPIYYNNNNSKNNVEKQSHSSNKNSQLKVTKKQSDCTRRSEIGPLLQSTTSSPLPSNLPINHSYQVFKPKGWIVVDKSDPSRNIDQRMDTNITSSLNRIKLSVDQQQNVNSKKTIGDNVSVLEIKRNVNSNTDNLVRDTHPYSNIQQPQQQPQTYSSSFSNQMFKSTQQTLCEDVERYRAQFNGQLLDLLTRQNWCESIISEKLKFYQNHTSQVISSLNIQKETQAHHSTNHPHLLKLIYSKE